MNTSFLPTVSELYGYSDTLRDFAKYASDVAKEQVAERFSELKETAVTLVNSHMNEETILPDVNPKVTRKNEPKKHQLRAKNLDSKGMRVNVVEASQPPARLTNMTQSPQIIKSESRFTLTQVNTIVNVVLVLMVLLLIVATTGKFMF
jgi:hypothetical protein